MSALERVISQVSDVDALRRGAVAANEAQNLDALCRALAALFADAGAADPDALRKGLGAVQRVGEALEGGGLPTSGASQWQATMAALPLTGGRVLRLEDRAGTQELAFHLDAKGTLYLGSWASLKEVADAPAVLFAVRQGAEGWEIRLSNGQQERSTPLGEDLPGFSWSDTPILIDQSEGKAALDELLQGLVEKAAEAAEQKAEEPAPPAGLACPSCGELVPSGSRFCNHCGAVLGCPSCGATIPPGSRFCSQCGQPLGS